MASARFLVPGCVDFPFEVDWSGEAHSLFASMGAGNWPFAKETGIDGYADAPFSEAGISCSSYALK
jgi:hypothetical protein